MLFSISVLEGIAELAPSKCCWRNIGAVFRTAPFLIANVAQLSTICATTRGEGGEKLMNSQRSDVLVLRMLVRPVKMNPGPALDRPLPAVVECLGN